MAKEAAYKAQFMVTGRLLGFHDVRLAGDAAECMGLAVGLRLAEGGGFIVACAVIGDDCGENGRWFREWQCIVSPGGAGRGGTMAEVSLHCDLGVAALGQCELLSGSGDRQHAAHWIAPDGGQGMDASWGP